MDKQIWLLTDEVKDTQDDIKAFVVKNCVDVMLAVTMGRYYDIETIMDSSCNEECQDMFKLLTKIEEE